MKSFSTIKIFTLFCFLLVAVTQGSGDAPNCKPGTFRSGSVCKRCPAGTFQSKSNRTWCKKCPQDMFNPFQGSWTSLFCFRCPQNSVSGTGAAGCTKCEGNSTASCGKCIRCPPGTFVSCGSCKPCQNNKISTEYNSQRCDDCPYGHPASNDRTKCLPDSCPPGFENTSSPYDPENRIPLHPTSDCWVCGGDRYRNATMKDCEECPPRYAVNNASRPTSCVLCPPETFLLPVFRYSRICRPCSQATGRYKHTYGYGKTLCRRRNEDCPYGMFLDGDGDCNRCFKGERLDLKINLCVPCPEGFTSHGGNTTTCISKEDTALVNKAKCLPGQKYDNYDGCFCPEGTKIIRGRCQTDFGLKCDAFSVFIVQDGRAVCKPCPKNMYSLPTKGLICVPLRKCPRGYILQPDVSFFDQFICISGRTGCPKGMKSLGITKRHPKKFVCGDKHGKVLCPHDKVFDGTDRCIKCSPGSRIIEKNGVLQCKSCRHNEISIGGVVRHCQKCQKGFIVDMNKCICRGGKYIKDKECVDCPRQFSVTFETAPIGCRYN